MGKPCFAIRRLTLATYGSEAPSDCYIICCVAKSYVIVLAALIDGDVAGGRVASELDRFEQERREIYATIWL